jgi:hypothetical protein
MDEVVVLNRLARTLMTVLTTSEHDNPSEDPQIVAITEEGLALPMPENLTKMMLAFVVTSARRANRLISEAGWTTSRSTLSHLRGSS